MPRENTASLLYRIKRLGRSATVLHVGAHPDDEEIGLFPYITFKHYGKAVYWSATRGEGGQNRINQYRGRALGIYRTWESLAAREIDGGECLFGPFDDFGFSKNGAEVFLKWGKEDLVRELVYAIRFVRPQVVVARWAGTEADGHGHHQAVGLAVRDAFGLAGVPEAYDDLTKEGPAPWAPRKMYVSVNKPTLLPTGRIMTRLERDGVVRINTGEYSHVLGRTYQEQAWEALNRHQTQGVSALPAPGDFYYYLRLLKATGELCTGEKDIFEGIDTSLAGAMSGLADVPGFVAENLIEVGHSVNRAVCLFDVELPSASSPSLLEGLSILKDLRDRMQREPVSPMVRTAILACIGERTKEFESVIGATLGFRLESTSTRGKVTPGESIWMTNKLWNFGRTPIDKVTFAVSRPEDWQVPERDEDRFVEQTQDGCMSMEEISIGQEAELSCPYWLTKVPKGAIYDLPGGPFQQPFSPTPLRVECEVTLGGHAITLSAPTIHRRAFPGGFSELPLAIVPPISLHPEFDKTFVLAGETEQRVAFRVVARCNDEERPGEGTLTLTGPEDWQIEPSSLEVNLAPVGGARTCTFEATIPSTPGEGRYELNFNITCRGRSYGVVLTPVRMGTPGLPHPDDAATCMREEFLLAPARVAIHVIRAKYGKEKRYAYIQGAKEEMLATFIALGLNFVPLSCAEIAHGELDAYDAIVVGPNAYLLRSEVRDNAHRLLGYMENGGTLIVQYHGYGYQRGNLAPYPFKYSSPHDRVTDETAPITILKPHDPLFHFPNPIGERDFDGWVHDRGLYFFGAWDERYTPLLSSADLGESQKKGGLIRCSYGKGIYFYLGYSLFRQVPAGVPGPVRLFFNMLCSGSRET